MKLIIQIPCFNESEQLPGTLADLPHEVPGIDEIEVLIIDDGSSDGTSAVAREHRVHHIVRFPQNRGLSEAYRAGLDAALRLGADVVVNTDADNQYRGVEIARLVAPILERRADIVVGDRQTDSIAHFSFLKRLLQRWGSGLVRRVSGTVVADATSGFRALSRRAVSSLFIHNRFTYTLETLVQAGATGLAVVNVTVATNPMTRKSRLFRSIPHYLSRNGPVIFRAYAMYQPVRTFGLLALVLLVIGAAGLGRFVYFYLLDPNYSGHIQSLVASIGAVILSFLVAMFALLSDLLAANRRYLEELTQRLRRMEADLAISRGKVDGVESTGESAWTPNKEPS